MDQSLNQLNVITVELPAKLFATLRDRGIAVDIWQTKAVTELEGLLAEIGIPEEAVVETKESDLVHKPTILVNGFVLGYSLQLVKTVVGYVSPKSHLTNLDSSWVGAIADRLSKDELGQFLTSLVVEVVKQRPEQLLKTARTAAYLKSAGETFPELKPAELPLDRVQTILENILSMRISIGNRHLIVDQMAQGFADQKSDAEISENLISRLAPDQIELAMPPEYLKQLFGVALKGTQSISIYEIGKSEDPMRRAFQAMTDQIFIELGLRVPDLVLVLAKDLKPNAFTIKINHITGCRHLGLDATLSPATDASATATEDIPETEASKAEASTSGALGYLIETLQDDLRRNAGCLLHSDIVEYEIARLHQVYPRTTSITLEDLPLSRITRTLRELLHEQVNIRHLRLIAERILTCDYVVTDPGKYIVFDDRMAFHAEPHKLWRDDGHSLAQRVRAGMKRYLGYRYSQAQVLHVYLVGPEIEESLLSHLSQTTNSESGKGLSNEEIEKIQAAIRDEVDVPISGTQPVILTSPEIRYFLRRLIEFEFPSLAVLSWDELSPEMNIQPLARITLST
jgi:type III secretory pathway component EscV